METEPLKAPPPLLEGFVGALVPPAAQEAVMGDLFELYQSPLQYVVSAARTIPFVLASQIRRQANIPVMILQALASSACFIGILLSLHRPLVTTNLLLVIAATIVVALILDVYRNDKPASENWAALGAIITSIAVVAYVFYVLVLTLHANRIYARQFSWTFFPWLIITFGMPLLCALRASFIIGLEAFDDVDVDDMSHKNIMQYFSKFEAQARLRNNLEIVLLIFSGAISGLIMWRAGLTLSLVGSLVAAIYAASVLYLLVYGAPNQAVPEGDFLYVRIAFQQEMTRQYQLRALVGWLGPTPLVYLLYAAAFHYSAGPTHELWLMYATLTTICGAFLVLTANRDRGARLRRITNHLDRLREQPSS
jgi:hypothetical protein